MPITGSLPFLGGRRYVPGSFEWTLESKMRASFSLPAAGIAWSIDHIQTLRRLVQEGRSVKDIALAMKRSESAIRNKAVMHGISLRVARKSTQPASVRQQQSETPLVATLGTHLQWL